MQVTQDAMRNRLHKWGLKATRQLYTVAPEILERNAQILTLFNNGEGLAPAEIARQFNISRERVRQILEKHGVDAGLNQTKKIESWQSKVAEHRKQHPFATDEEIGQAVGVSGQNVRRWRKQNQAPVARDKAFYEARAKARFWTKIDITANPDECWNWTGCINRTLNMPHTSKLMGKTRAQVIVWMLTKGEPKNYVSTTCDNATCCNPNHLADVTFDKIIEKRARTYARR